MDKKDIYDFFKEKNYFLIYTKTDYDFEKKVRCVNKYYPFSKKDSYSYQQLKLEINFNTLEFNNVIVFKDIIPLKYLYFYNAFLNSSYYTFQNNSYNGLENQIKNIDKFHYKKVSQNILLKNVSSVKTIDINDKKYRFQIIDFIVSENFNFYKN